MAFTGRSRATIRDSILATWSAEYISAGQRPLLIAPGSDAYLQAAALAVILEGLEAQAESVSRDILPDQASPEALARHGEVDGVPRGAGVRARHTVTVSSGVDSTYTFATGVTFQMAYSDGTLYTVDSTAVTIAAGTGTIEVTAVDIGVDPTRAVADTLTFVSAPTGLNSTGAVASIATTGTDLESISDWAQRIIENRRERPASGNRADWRSWVRAYTGTDIATAYVYPLLEPPASFPGAGVADTPGCVTAVAVGLAQGSSFTNTRIVPTDDGATRTAGAQLTRIMEYVEGERTEAGATTTTGTQLRPTSLPEGNYSIEAINTSVQNVVLSCTVTTANAFPWVGAIAIILSTDTTIKVTGDYTALEGLRALVLPATPTARGSYRAVTLGSPVFAAGDTTFTQAAGQEVGFPTGSIYPCPGNWDDIKTAVFAHFDGLGPGDTTPASRWPPESTEARATLYRTGLAADVINGVPTTTTTREAATATAAATVTTVTSLTSTGVLSCTVTTPVADVTPAAKTVVTLGSLLVTP